MTGLSTSPFLLYFFLLCLGYVSCSPEALCSTAPTLEFTRGTCPVSFGSMRMKTTEGMVQVDEYHSSNTSRGIILFIHGAEGVLSSTPTSTSFDNGGENALACAGFDVFIPHYLEAFGFHSIYNISLMEAQSAKWTDALKQVLQSIQSRKPASNIYVYGRSLGGYIALRLASNHPGVTGLILVSAGLRPNDSLSVSNLPATLIVQGTDDRIVPADQAKALDTAPGWKTVHKLVLVERSGHNLYLENGRIVSLIIDFSSSLIKDPAPN